MSGAYCRDYQRAMWPSIFDAAGGIGFLARGENNASTPSDILCRIKDARYEPVGLWLPDSMRPAGTDIYAYGVEVQADYAGEISDGFDVILLVPCKLLGFQGEPYNDEEFSAADGRCMEHIGKVMPEVYGYQYADGLARVH